MNDSRNPHGWTLIDLRATFRTADWHSAGRRGRRLADDYEPGSALHGSSSRRLSGCLLGSGLLDVDAGSDDGFTMTFRKEVGDTPPF